MWADCLTDTDQLCLRWVVFCWKRLANSSNSGGCDDGGSSSTSRRSSNCDNGNNNNSNNNDDDDNYNHNNNNDIERHNYSLLSLFFIVVLVCFLSILTMLPIVSSMCDHTWLYTTCITVGVTRGVTVSMSAFLACHQCYCAGSSLAWGLNLRALVCGIFWSSSPGVFSGYSGFLPSFIGLMVQPIK